MIKKSIIFPQKNTAALVDEEFCMPVGKNILVKTEISTISNGTERANISGDPNVSITQDSHMSMFPRRCGYSSAGVVFAVGQDVTEVKIGDRVALTGGSHSQYIQIPEDSAHIIMDEKISFNEAALMHIGTFPMAAIRKCHLEIGESAVVMGLGVLGLMAVQQLRAAGATPVIAVDPNPEKRSFALNIGADFAFDPFDKDFADNVKSVTGGGANVAIEVTGSGKALDEVLDCMAKMGRVALLGCTRSSDFTLDYYHKVHGPGISLIGAHTSARPKQESSNGLWTLHDDVIAQFKLVLGHRLDLKALISEVHSPVEAPEVYSRLIAEPSFPVVQFDWSKI